jgi:hypothetical protein
MKTRASVGASFSEWTAAPSHQNKDRSHDIADIHFAAKAGEANTLLCRCGWTCSEPTADHLDKAYVQHRREVGLQASILTINTAYSMPKVAVR